jgi:23S rRNA pseudouridine1911/1915/1917 synthase
MSSLSANSGKQQQEIEVSGKEAGNRLDRVLAERSELSRTRLKSLILAGEVTVGGRTVRDPSHRVNAGDVIVVNVPEPEAAEPAGEDIPLKIVFEDDEIIVIDKPAGLVVHPAAGHASGTLVNALIAHCGDSLSGIGGVKRPGIVHRLDKDTTGLMVVAKTDRAHQALAAQFADHGRTGPLKRGYLALAWGAPPRPKGTVDAPLGRHPKSRDKIAIRKDGRHAITHWHDRVPAGNRPHPPDPGTHGPYRPPAAGRPGLWPGLPHQGRPAAAGGPRCPGGPWQTGPACLFTVRSASDHRPAAGVPLGTPG